MAKWQRIEDDDDPQWRSVDDNPVDMGTGKWSQIVEERTAAYQRTIVLCNIHTKENYELHEFLDWDGNLITRQGDSRLQPIMDATVSIEAEFDDLDKDAILRKTAPALQQVLLSVTGQKFEIDDIMENIVIQTGGNWRGFKHGHKFERLN